MPCIGRCWPEAPWDPSGANGGGARMRPAAARCGVDTAGCCGRICRLCLENVGLARSRRSLAPACKHLVACVRDVRLCVPVRASLVAPLCAPCAGCSCCTVYVRRYGQQRGGFGSAPRDACTHMCTQRRRNPMFVIDLGDLLRWRRIYSRGTRCFTLPQPTVVTCAIFRTSRNL